MKKLLLKILLLFPLFTFSQEKGLDEKFNEWFKPISDAWGGIVFYPVTFPGGVQMPLVIILLLSAGLIFQ